MKRNNTNNGATDFETRLLSLLLEQSTVGSGRFHIRMLIQCAPKKTAAGGFLLMTYDTVICCLHHNLLLGGYMVYEKLRMACMKVPQWQTFQHHTPVGAKESSGRASSTICCWSWDSKDRKACSKRGSCSPVDQTLVVHSCCEPLQREPQSLLELVTQPACRLCY